MCLCASLALGYIAIGYCRPKQQHHKNNSRTNSSPFNEREIYLAGGALRQQPSIQMNNDNYGSVEVVAIFEMAPNSMTRTPEFMGFALLLEVAAKYCRIRTIQIRMFLFQFSGSPFRGPTERRGATASEINILVEK